MLSFKKRDAKVFIAQTLTEPINHTTEQKLNKSHLHSNQFVTISDQMKQILNTFLQEKQQYQDNLRHIQEQQRMRYQLILYEKNRSIKQLEQYVSDLRDTVRQTKEDLQKAKFVIQQKNQLINMLNRQIQNKDLRNYLKQINPNINSNVNKLNKSRVFQEFNQFKSVNVSHRDTFNQSTNRNKPSKKSEDIVLIQSSRVSATNLIQKKSNKANIQNIKIKTLQIKGKENLEGSCKRLLNSDAKILQKIVRKSLPTARFYMNSKQIKTPILGSIIINNSSRISKCCSSNSSLNSSLKLRSSKRVIKR